MEVFGLRTLLNWFKSTGLMIRVLVTDRSDLVTLRIKLEYICSRSKSVRQVMKDEYSEIVHQFDVW